MHTKSCFCAWFVIFLFAVPFSADALYARPCVYEAETYIAIQNKVVIGSFQYREAASGPCAQKREIFERTSFSQQTLNLPDGVWVIKRDRVSSVPMVTVPGAPTDSLPSGARGAEQLSDDPTDLKSYLGRKQLAMSLAPVLNALIIGAISLVVAFGFWLVARSWTSFVTRHIGIKLRSVRILILSIGLLLPGVFIFWGAINMLNGGNIPRFAIDVLVIMNLYVIPVLFFGSLFSVVGLTCFALCKKFLNRKLVDDKMNR